MELINFAILAIIFSVCICVYAGYKALMWAIGLVFKDEAKGSQYLFRNFGRKK